MKSAEYERMRRVIVLGSAKSPLKAEERELHVTFDNTDFN